MIAQFCTIIIRENLSQRKPIYYFFAILVIYSRSMIITRTPGRSWLSVSAMPRARSPPPMTTWRAPHSLA